MSASADNRPFAIQLEVEFLDRLSEPVRDGKAKSVSELIRAALERFDLSKVVVVRPSQLIISVRLPAATRDALKQAARTKHTSVGQLVRAAVESYLPQLESATAGQLEMPIPHVELPEESPPQVAPLAAPPPRKKSPRRKRPAKKNVASRAKKKPAPRAAARRRAKQPAKPKRAQR